MRSSVNIVIGRTSQQSICCIKYCCIYTFSQLHEFDELRFDIRGHECTYFLRARSVKEKDSWVEAIEVNKVTTHRCIVNVAHSYIAMCSTLGVQHTRTKKGCPIGVLQECSTTVTCVAWETLLKCCD